jgi:HpcH/HpaI aldolase/citrate lyase family protein
MRARSSWARSTSSVQAGGREDQPRWRAVGEAAVKPTTAMPSPIRPSRATWRTRGWFRGGSSGRWVVRCISRGEEQSIEHRACLCLPRLTVRLRPRVMAGEVTLGTFIGTASPVIAEVCAAAGFDWLRLDLEHGTGGEEQARTTVPAAAAHGVPTIVRVESDARIRVGRMLDAGVAGVMVPAAGQR